MFAPLAVALLSLGAVTHNVALLAPSKPPHEADQNELRTARETAALVSRMLDELGIHADTVSQNELLAGGAPAAAIYYPGLQPVPGRADGRGPVAFRAVGRQAAGLLPAAAAIGGIARLRPCRVRPPAAAGAVRRGPFRRRLAGAAALRPARFVEHHGRRPAGHHARVIGRWYDEAGQPTGRAALLLSDRGILQPYHFGRRSRGQEADVGGPVGPFLAAALATDGPGRNRSRRPDRRLQRLQPCRRAREDRRGCGSPATVVHGNRKLGRRRRAIR